MIKLRKKKRKKKKFDRKYKEEIEKPAGLDIPVQPTNTPCRSSYKESSFFIVLSFRYIHRSADRERNEETNGWLKISFLVEEKQLVSDFPHQIP